MHDRAPGFVEEMMALAFEVTLFNPLKLNTLRDIFTRIKNLGIEIMLGQKYGDFFKKSPNFVPRIKLAHFHPNLFKRNQTQFLKKFHN